MNHEPSKISMHVELKPRMNTASVGVCAYNEDKNIRSTLTSILAQDVKDYPVIEVIVVSSGSTDGTDSIVQSIVHDNPQIRLIRQENREGKNSAINLFMGLAKGDVLVLVNADNTLEADALPKLLEPFKDPIVGMVGGHPVPSNEKGTIAGFAVHMLWDMHHRLSLIYPKAGELVAFRNPQLVLPTTMQSDEDIIRMALEKKGFKTVYAPEAIVHNKGPTTIRDFFKQRTRVNIGEQYMKRIYAYEVPTWNARFLFASYLGFLKDNRRQLPKMLAAMALEGAARLYAAVYVLLDRGDKAVWNQVASTKDVGKD
jgi:poly-beta-1,6-N-acetyl-D-glucosamine synthase